jgi:hypothetical protein
LRRLRRTLIAALTAFVGLASLVGSPPTPASAAEAPIPVVADVNLLPLEGAVVPTSFEVRGLVQRRADAVTDTRRIAILDLAPSAQGYSCGTSSAVECELQVLGALNHFMEVRGSTTVAVFVVGEPGGDKYIDLDPSTPGSQKWASAAALQQLLASSSLLQQPRSFLDRSALLDAAALGGLHSAEAPRAWLITPGSSLQLASGDLDALDRSHLPVDVYTVETGAGTPCGTYTNSIPDALASFTHGTCIRQSQLTAPVSGTLHVQAVLSAGQQLLGSAFMVLGPGQSSFSLPMQAPGSPDGTATLTVTVVDAFWRTNPTTVTRHLLLGNAPSIDLGGPVTVDEGSTAVLGAVSITTDSGLRTVAWTPASAFTDPTQVRPTFVATADDAVIPVTVSATSGRGRTAAASTDVTVRNVAPTLLSSPSETVLNVGEYSSLQLDVTDPGTQDAHTVSIEWGDGTAEVVQLPAGERYRAVPHAFSQPGLFIYRLSAVDDDGGRSALNGGYIEVRDTQAPVFTSTPEPRVLEATGPTGAVLRYALPTASDDNVMAPTVTCNPPSGATVPLGRTTVSCAAIDDADNFSETTFTVDVVDTTPPVLSGVPASITQPTGPEGTATPSFTAPTAHDLVDGDVPVRCTPTTGLPVGSHVVTCTATDAAGNAASDSFEVEIVDGTAPVLGALPADLELRTGSAGTAVATYDTPTATDNVEGDVTVRCTPPSGSALAVGRHVVTCTARDAAGNASTGSFVVTVTDGTAPVLDGLPADQRLRTGPGGTATIAYTPPTAHDLVDPDVAVTCTPAPGTALPVGHHRISCTAVDDAGNTTTGSFTIDVVPGYRFEGFDNPVDRGVWNVVKAGQAVPLKWQVLDADGRAVSDLAAVQSVTSYPLSCTSGQADDPVEVVAAGSSGLRFDAATGRYQLNWKVPSSAGCYRLVVRLADGTTGTADFKVR